MGRQDSDRLSLNPGGTTQGNANADLSNSDQQASGDAAVRRITDDDGDTLPSYDQILAMLLGPLAGEIAPSDIPPEIEVAAREILSAIAQEAAAASSASTDTKPAAKPDAKADAKPDAKPDAKKDDASPFDRLRDRLDALIADKVASVIAISPKGRALADKFEAFEKAHPGFLFEVLLLAATAALGREAKIPELSHTFKIGGAWSATGGVSLGTTRHITLSAIRAAIEYKKGKVAATAAFSRDFTAKSTTFSGEVTFKDLAFLHHTIDETLLSYKHVDTAGKRPTDQIMEQVTFKLQGIGFKLAETNTWAPPKSSGTKGTTPADRVLSEKLTEEIKLPAWHDYKLELDGTQSFGPKHPQDTIGGKLSLPKFDGIGVTVGETLPLGTGTSKPQFGMEIDFKGVTLSIKQGTTPTTGSSAAASMPALGTFNETHGGWTVGVSIPLGHKKKDD